MIQRRLFVLGGEVGDQLVDFEFDLFAIGHNPFLKLEAAECRQHRQSRPEVAPRLIPCESPGGCQAGHHNTDENGRPGVFGEPAHGGPPWVRVMSAVGRVDLRLPVLNRRARSCRSYPAHFSGEQSPCGGVPPFVPVGPTGIAKRPNQPLESPCLARIPPVCSLPGERR